MRWLAIAATLGLPAACGRVDFQGHAAGDGAVTDAVAAVDAVDAPRVPIRFVQSIGASGGAASVGAMFASDVQPGDTLIIAVDYDSSASDTPRITDSLGSVFTTVLAPVTAPSLTVTSYVASARVTGAGGTDTVQATFDESVGSELRLHEFAGLGGADTGSAATGQAHGSVSAPPSSDVTGPAITTSDANELVFAFELSAAEPGPESMLALDFDTDITEFLLAPTPGVYQPTAVIENGSAWEISAMAFHGL